MDEQVAAESVRGHVVVNISKKSITELVEIADLVMDVSTSSSSIVAAHQQKSDTENSTLAQLQETVKKRAETVSRLHYRPRGVILAAVVAIAINITIRPHRHHPTLVFSSTTKNMDNSQPVNVGSHANFHRKIQKTSSGWKY